MKEAKDIYCEILESEVMEGVISGSGETPPSSSTTILRLKFLIFKNIASIANEQGHLSEAVDAYIEVGMSLVINCIPPSSSPLYRLLVWMLVMSQSGVS